MLTEAVAVIGENCACLVKLDPARFSLCDHLGTRVVAHLCSDFKRLDLSGCYICNIGPGALLGTPLIGLLVADKVFNGYDWRYSQSKGRLGHQIRYDALMGSSFVNLAELLLVVDFHSDSVL